MHAFGCVSSWQRIDAISKQRRPHLLRQFSEFISNGEDKSFNNSKYPNMCGSTETNDWSKEMSFKLIQKLREADIFIAFVLKWTGITTEWFYFVDVKLNALSVSFGGLFLGGFIFLCFIKISRPNTWIIWMSLEHFTDEITLVVCTSNLFSFWKPSSPKPSRGSIVLEMNTLR